MYARDSILMVNFLLNLCKLVYVCTYINLYKQGIIKFISSGTKNIETRITKLIFGKKQKGIDLHQMLKIFFKNISNAQKHY